MPIIAKLWFFLLIILDFDVVLIFLKPQTSICLKNFSLATRAFSNSETAKLSCWQRRQEASDSFAQYCSPWPSCPWPPCLPLHHPPLTTIYLNRIGPIETPADGDNLVFLLIINKGGRSRAHLKACISLNVGDPRCLWSWRQTQASPQDPLCSKLPLPWPQTAWQNSSSHRFLMSDTDQPLYVTLAFFSTAGIFPLFLSLTEIRSICSYRRYQTSLKVQWVWQIAIT